MSVGQPGMGSQGMGQPGAGQMGVGQPGMGEYMQYQQQLLWQQQYMCKQYQ